MCAIPEKEIEVDERDSKSSQASEREKEIAVR
jgi:hypothetical protein